MKITKNLLLVKNVIFANNQFRVRGHIIVLYAVNTHVFRVFNQDFSSFVNYTKRKNNICNSLVVYVRKVIK